MIIIATGLSDHHKMFQMKKRARGEDGLGGVAREVNRHLDNTVAVAWLQGSLRVADNTILLRAAAASPGSLAIVVVWRCGDRVPTPALSFAAAAMRSLHKELRKLGNGLTVLYSAEDTERSAAAAVAAHAMKVGAATVVVDCSDEAGVAAATYVHAACSTARGHGRAVGQDARPIEVVAVQDDTLFTHQQALSLLGESEAGGGARVLRWAGFLKAAAKLPPPPPPSPAPISLPPPPLGTQFGKRLRLPADSAWWGVPTLNGWLKLTGAPISEEGGQQLASQAGQRAVSGGRPGFGIKTLGQRKGASDDADGRAPARRTHPACGGVTCSGGTSHVRPLGATEPDCRTSPCAPPWYGFTLVNYGSTLVLLHLGTASPWYCFTLVGPLPRSFPSRSRQLPPIPLATASHPARDRPVLAHRACSTRGHPRHPVHTDRRR
jgi:hypothetical protein